MARSSRGGAGWRRRWRLAAGLLVLLLLGTLSYGCSEALRPPVVRSHYVALPDWPAAQPPVRIALISDIHITWPDMPPSRVQRLVAQVNALQPDIVLIAGDLMSDRLLAVHYPKDVIAAALAGLNARYGVYAVYGNHDHELGPVELRRGLTRAGIITLVNDAALAGPVVIGGVDDDTTGHAELGETEQSALALSAGHGNAPIILFTHNPGIFPWMSPGFHLMLAGHTHCDQIRIPFIDFARYHHVKRLGRACGVRRLGDKLLIVTAGLGASGLPIRLNAPPDLWMVTVGGAR